MDYINNATVLEKMPWLSTARKEHIHSTAKTAYALAQRYNADADLAFTAGLYHDCAKGLEGELIKKYHDQLIPFIDYPDTVHAPLSACLARDMFLIKDPYLLSAIRWHCTGKSSMSMLDQIIYIADAIEPLRDYAGVEHLRKMSKVSLNAAVLACAKHTIEYLEKKGSEICPITLDCYYFYKETK